MWPEGKQVFITSGTRVVGTDTSHSMLPCNHEEAALGKDKSTTLPVFHCYTGCDTTSAFCGKRKKSAWIAWNSYTEVTQAFNYIAANPHTPVTIDAQHFQCLEHYTVVLYDKTNDLESVNDARRELFCQKTKAMEHIPPT